LKELLPNDPVKLYQMPAGFRQIRPDEISGLREKPLMTRLSASNPILGDKRFEAGRKEPGRLVFPDKNPFRATPINDVRFIRKKPGHTQVFKHNDFFHQIHGLRFLCRRIHSGKRTVAPAVLFFRTGSAT
jgi:hypothetical protein